MMYKSDQDSWLKKHGIGKGSKVKIVRMPKSDDRGEFSTWVQQMDNLIGLKGKVLRIHDKGVKVMCIKDGLNETWNYPFFCLEPVFDEDEYGKALTKWVKENNVKVGDRVKVISPWFQGERGFEGSFDGYARERVAGNLTNLGRVELFESAICGIRHIKVRFDDKKIGTYPFFALELVKDETFRLEPQHLELEVVSNSDDWKADWPIGELVKIVKPPGHGAPESLVGKTKRITGHSFTGGIKFVEIFSTYIVPINSVVLVSSEKSKASYRYTTLDEVLARTEKETVSLSSQVSKGKLVLSSRTKINLETNL